MLCVTRHNRATLADPAPVRRADSTLASRQMLNVDKNSVRRKTPMSMSKRSQLVMGGLLSLGITALFAPDALAAETGGSALPPGVNPSSPAGGSGGDAQGYETKPANPEPAGTDKKAAGTQAPVKHTQPSKTDRTHSNQKKAAPTQR